MADISPVVVQPVPPASPTATVDPFTNSRLYDLYNLYEFSNNDPIFVNGCEYGQFEYGTGVVYGACSVPAASIQSVRVVHTDMLEITLSSEVIVDSSYLDTSNYCLCRLSEIGQDIVVKEVVTPKDLTSSTIRLITEPQSDGAEYSVGISGVRFTDGSEVALLTSVFARPTKTTSMFGALPNHYSRQPGSPLRTLIEAIAQEDDNIGGSRKDPVT